MWDSPPSTVVGMRCRIRRKAIVEPNKGVGYVSSGWWDAKLVIQLLSRFHIDAGGRWTITISFLPIFIRGLGKVTLRTMSDVTVEHSESLVVGEFGSNQSGRLVCCCSGLGLVRQINLVR